MRGESGEMFEELNKWILFLNRLQNLALEMESHEQDTGYLNNQIAQLMDEPEDDYTLTFHDPHKPSKVRLSIQWQVVPFDEKAEDVK